jgi:hypothetical protein
VLQKEGHEVLIYDRDCNVSPSKIDFAINSRSDSTEKE